MIALILVPLTFVIPCAVVETLRGMSIRGRERREWKWIKARYFGG